VSHNPRPQWAKDLQDLGIHAPRNEEDARRLIQFIREGPPLTLSQTRRRKIIKSIQTTWLDKRVMDQRKRVGWVLEVVITPSANTQMLPEIRSTLIFQAHVVLKDASAEWIPLSELLLTGPVQLTH
jgi:hypothetical protein